MRKIALFHPEGNINTNPNLCSFCNELAANGYIIDVWSVLNPDIPDQMPAQCNVNLFFTAGYNEIDPIVSDYSFSIGVDRGIVPAWRLAKALSISYAFLSYELFFDEELTGRLAITQKNKEKEACRNVTFAIIQDKLRATCLEKEYGIPKEKMLYMPVAGKGITQYNPSYFLHDHLGISHNTKILLHFGSVAEWTMTNWVIEHADSLPEGWQLVIHNKSGKISVSDNHPNVKYSNLPFLPFNKISDLLQSASCTLALYNPTVENPYTGKNLENIGLASGKISTSLQYGIPVITNDIGELSELIHAYKAGFVVDTTSTDPFIILENNNIGVGFTANCQRLFTEKLDIGSFAARIIEVIQIQVKNKENTEIDLSHFPGLQQKVLHYHNRLTLKNQIKIIFKLMMQSFRNIRSGKRK